jgi:hypothetical protein
MPFKPGTAPKRETDFDAGSWVAGIRREAKSMPPEQRRWGDFEKIDETATAGQDSGGSDPNDY